MTLFKPLLGFTANQNTRIRQKNDNAMKKRKKPIERRQKQKRSPVYRLGQIRLLGEERSTGVSTVTEMGE